MPQGKVGAVSVGDGEVRVAPKVPIDRIVFMLAHAMGGVTWQEQSVGVEQDSDGVHVVAEAYLRAVSSIIIIYRRYIEVIPCRSHLNCV